MGAEYEKETVLDLLIHPAYTGKPAETVGNVILFDNLAIA
jgi:hypothetical protein